MAIAATLVGSVISGVMGSRAARRAAQAQERAAQADIAFQTETRDQIRSDLRPFVQGGTDAQNALAYLMGLSPEAPMIGGAPAEVMTIPAGQQYPGTSNNAPRYVVNGQVFNSRAEADQAARAAGTAGTRFQGFQETPGFRFALREGLDAVESGAAARGGLFSGATMQALQQRGNDMANLEFGNYLSRLGGMASGGQNAAGMQANAGQNTANAVGAAFGNIGNAQSAGAIGGANAWQNAINNGIGLIGYQNALRQFGGAPSGGGGGMFSGLMPPAWSGTGFGTI